MDYIYKWFHCLIYLVLQTCAVKKGLGAYCFLLLLFFKGGVGGKSNSIKHLYSFLYCWERRLDIIVKQVHVWGQAK